MQLLLNGLPAARWASALIVLACTGCDAVPRPWSKQDVRDIAQDAALFDPSELDERITTLEEKNRELEAQIESINSRIGY